MSKIIDTSEPKEASRFRFKKPVIIALVLVLVGVAGSALLLTQRNLNPLAKNTDETVDPVMSAYDEATKLANTKSIDEANKFYDQQIAGSKNSEEKISLLMDKASIAYNAGDFDTALKAALDADAIKSSAGTLSMIAQSYEGKGDKAKALEYYKKALAVLPKSEVTNRQEVTLKSKIAELSN